MALVCCGGKRFVAARGLLGSRQHEGDVTNLGHLPATRKTVSTAAPASAQQRALTGLALCVLR